MLKLQDWSLGFKEPFGPFALAAALVPIPLQMYNNVEQVCWIESSPYECKDSFRYGAEANCERGDNAWLMAFAFSIFPTWACILLGCVFMFLIYRSVRETEVRIARYAGGIATAAPNQHASSNAYDSSTDVTEPSRKARVASHKRSQAVAIQSMWYLGAFLLTYTMHLAVYICWKFKQQWWEPLDFFAYLLLPLQGFFNFVIFSRKREDMSTPEGHLLRRLICCLYCRRWVGRYQVRRRSLNSKASGQSTAANGETLVSMGANESEAVMERTSEEQEEHKQEPPKNRSTSVDAV